MLTIPQALALALQHHTAGRLTEAEPLYRQILAVNPQHADAWHLLGMIAHQVGRNAEAIAWIEHAITLHPTAAAFRNNLGNIRLALGESEAAVACYREALRCQPAYADAQANLGRALFALKRFEEGVAACRAAVASDPGSIHARLQLGLGLILQRDVDGAMEVYRELLRLHPQQPEALVRLSALHHARAEHDASLACLRTALAARPDDAALHSQLLFFLQCHPASDDTTLRREHRAWNEQHALPLRPAARPVAREPERRLRIGYVSPDLRDHAVGRFLVPLLAQHDRTAFEVCCYSDATGDEFTTTLRGHTDRWRDTRGMKDDAVAAAIREDGIDVLVDLALHSSGNRLLVFARQPAPVQVSYLAYLGTTGLDAIGHRLTDPFLDPPGSSGCVHLPETYWCFTAPADAPEVAALPALATGRVTFGCLNNFCKVTPATLALWSRVLRAVGDARLLLHAHPGSHRQRVLEHFAASGIAPERIEFSGHLPHAEYLALHGRTDLALDPFPFGGGTTTCEALWMGVPVVTLAGERAVSRGGLSILSNLGLPELVAHTEDDYVRIAATLAHDLPRLAALRATLRARMLASPLMDAPRFTRHVEAAYRALWCEACSLSAP